MSDAESPAPRKQNVVPMLRRIGEVIRTVFGLVDSLEQLKGKNDVLTAKVDELRREVDQQAGQVRVLMEFVRSALDDRVEKRVQAAARAVLAEFETNQATKSPTKKK